MQIIHPNQIINTYTLSFVHVICPSKSVTFYTSWWKNSHLLTPAVGFTPLPTQPSWNVELPTLSSLLLFLQPILFFFFLLPSFQFSKLQLANKLKKISDPSEFRELFEASQFQLQSSPSLSVFPPSFSSYPSLPLSGLVNEDEEIRG